MTWDELKSPPFPQATGARFFVYANPRRDQGRYPPPGGFIGWTVQLWRIGAGRYMREIVATHTGEASL